MTTTSSTSVTTSGSTTYLTGTISGLDTDALVEAAVAQKTARADTIDAKITANETKIAAYETLQSLVAAVSDSLTDLASKTYSVLGSSNAFDEKKAYVTASDGSDATKALAVSAESTAVAASYEISVLQLAKAMKVAAPTQSAATNLGVNGTFSLGLADGASAEITITDGMTLSDLAKAINAASDTTGVSATLLKISSDSYRLVLTAGELDQAIVTSSTSGDDVLAAIGMTGSDGAFSLVLQEAQPSIVTIDGLEVVSSSNQLTDVIPGLSISLSAVTGAGVSITLDIEPDLETVKTAITDFISAYNALRAFVVTNQTVGSDGTVPADAVLFGDALLRTIAKSLAELLNKSPSSADDSITSLSSLGITLNSGNQLVLSDETKLDDLLLTNLSGLADFFETKVTTSDSSLKLLKNDTSASLSFTLGLVRDETGAVTDVTVNGQSGLFTVSGARLVGAEGTIYAGLAFAFSDSTASSIDVTIAQGFANLMTTLAKTYSASSSGLIQNQIELLETLDNKMAERSATIRTDAETYRTSLITKYSKMEQALYNAQMLQAQIKAILGASDDDD